jgi:DNA-binding GntR family transcriptional regulator
MFDRSSPFTTSTGTQPQLPAAGSKVDFATSRLRQAIVTCELFPGENVSEQELTERFSLGRAATRGALAHLAGEGLVEVRPRKGWRVVPIVPRHIRDLAVARRVLEPLLVREAGIAQVIERLEQIAGINHALMHQGDESAVLTARRYDREFLDTLASAGNLWAARWLHQAWDSSERVVCFLEKEVGTRMRIPSRVSLVTALRDRDVSTAADHMADAVSDFELFTSEGLMSLRIDLPVGSSRKGAGSGKSRKNADTRDQPSVVQGA